MLFIISTGNADKTGLYYSYELCTISRASTVVSDHNELEVSSVICKKETNYVVIKV
jgi:hypothetical protein